MITDLLTLEEFTINILRNDQFILCDLKFINSIRLSAFLNFHMITNTLL